MSTKIHQHQHSHSKRSVDVHLEPPQSTRLRSTAEDGTVSVARIESRMRTESTIDFPDGAPQPVLSREHDDWFPPELSFADDGTPMRFTRAQWEVLKREVDAAFNAFEATWPLSITFFPCLPGRRHTIVFRPPEPVPMCNVCGKLVSDAVGRLLIEHDFADITADARAWFSRKDAP